MTAPGWRTSLIVQGVALRDGNAVPVVVGLIETAGGAVQFALRLGYHDPVLLSIQAGTQLIVNIRDAIDEWLKIAGVQGGGDQS